MNWHDVLAVDFWVRFGVAAACGGVLGLERQLKGKPAGIRTSMLVCVGTMMFVHLGVELGGPQTDPTRVLGQVVAGIGFLGAGVILNQQGSIQGMTSASVIWLLAAVGAAVGLDRPAAAIAMAGGAFGVLVGVSALERAFAVLRRGVHSFGGAASEDAGNGARQE